jgi:bacteriorhodopsin
MKIESISMFFSFWQVFTAISLFSLIILLFDLAYRDIKTIDKVIWIILSILIPLFAPIAYFAIKKLRIKNS